MIRRALTAAGGAVLAGATRMLAVLRPAEKPLHPVGVTLVGRIDRSGLAQLGSGPLSGVPWLDETGQDDVLVRLSRAIGLPAALPDIHGMAIRVVSGEHPGDVLLASTGWGRLGRFVLTAGRRPGSRPLTSLLPYRTPAGPVVLGARATGPASYELFWARYNDDWRRFANLELTGEQAVDQEISFDPVRRQIPGLAQYPAVVRLREPSYRRARRSRQEGPPR